jgi:hypothetical protein
MNRDQVAMERERQAIAAAASEITDLWWAKPQENGHIKTQVVKDILQKHLWGFTDAELRRGEG